jgi:hypothetical protein
MTVKFNGHDVTKSSKSVTKAYSQNKGAVRVRKFRERKKAMPRHTLKFGPNDRGIGLTDAQAKLFLDCVAADIPVMISCTETVTGPDAGKQEHVTVKPFDQWFS